jgi:hypothetical protein
VGASLGYRYSLHELNEIAPEDKRSEVVSTYLIACYFGVSLPIIGIGLLGKATSSLFADSLFAAMIALLAIGVLLFQFKSGSLFGRK